MKMTFPWSTNDSWLVAILAVFLFPHPAVNLIIVFMALWHGWGKHPLDKPMMLFCVGVGLVCLFQPVTSLYPLYLLSALVIFRQFSLMEVIPEVDKFILLGGAILLVIGLVQLVFDPGRVRSLTISPNIFGIYMAVVAVVHMDKGTSKLSQQAAAALGLILSGSRGAMLGLAAGVFSLMPKHKWVVVVVALIPAGAVALSRPAVDLNLLGESLRVNFWLVALDMFATSPIYGHGFGSFTAHWLTSYPAAFPYAAAHSLWFNLLAEGGLMLVIPFAYLLASIYLQLKPAGNWQEQTYNAALVALAVHASVDTPEANILALTALILAMRCRGETWERC